MKSQEKETVADKGKKLLDAIESLNSDSVTYLEGFLAGAQAASQTQKEEQHAKEETRASGSSR